MAARAHRWAFRALLSGQARNPFVENATWHTHTYTILKKNVCRFNCLQFAPLRLPSFVCVFFLHAKRNRGELVLQICISYVSSPLFVLVAAFYSYRLNIECSYYNIGFIVSEYCLFDRNRVTPCFNYTTLASVNNFWVCFVIKVFMLCPCKYFKHKKSP